MLNEVPQDVHLRVDVRVELRSALVQIWRSTDSKQLASRDRMAGAQLSWFY